MMEKDKIPQGAWLDADGKRWTKVLFDVMKDGGTRFVRQVKVTFGLHYDFGLGMYVIDTELDKIGDEAIRQYPSLARIKDMRLRSTKNRVK